MPASQQEPGPPPRRAPEVHASENPHGRFGESARAFAQRLAWARSQQLGTDFAADVARAYGVISVSLMRHQACLLLGAPMPGQRRAPFSRRGGVPDLPLVGGLR